MEENKRREKSWPYKGTAALYLRLEVRKCLFDLTEKIFMKTHTL